ncbi:uncharacterized protein LOC128954851 [Oppia nitens]|uniref:uncharacterized protein LOC128954851 n=1 Tax=Oppia nitens TaxID=1686743 RepID=UPI0023DCCAD0|nr:uncharacterized protein LOC128954851 [Oppia nitens]
MVTTNNITDNNNQNHRFCTNYVSNGYKLSYTFYKIVDTKLSVSVLVIGDHIWTVDSNFTVKLLPPSTVPNQLSGNKYRTAFSLYQKSNVFNYGFLRSDEPIVDWYEFNDKDSYDSMTPSSTSLNQSSTPMNITTAEQKLLFNPSFSLLLFWTTEMCFYTVMTADDGYVGRTQCWDFRNKSLAINITQKIVDDSDESVRPMFTIGNRHQYRPILIGTPIGGHYFTVFYIVNHTVVQVCRTGEDDYKFQCKSHIHTLFNCSSYMPSTNMTTMDTNTNTTTSNLPSNVTTSSDEPTIGNITTTTTTTTTKLTTRSPSTTKTSINWPLFVVRAILAAVVVIVTVYFAIVIIELVCALVAILKSTD